MREVKFLSGINKRKCDRLEIKPEENDVILQYVTLIGAANVDIQGFPFEKLISGDSNPGKVRICPGGVSRNIAENLSRMGVETELITAIGGGANGQYLIQSCRENGISIGHSLIIPEKDSSTYLAIMDVDGDMALALSDMSISDEISREFIKRNRNILEDSSIIELDSCLSEKVIEYILSEYSNVPIYIDPVSIGKAKKIKNNLKGIHTLKLNRIEAGFLSNSEIESEEDLKAAASYFLYRGVKRVFITLGKDGVYYYDGNTSGNIVPPPVKIKNATGAGDAFMAGVIFGSLQNYSMDKIAEYATGVSILALDAADTVNSEITVEKVKEIIKEGF